MSKSRHEVRWQVYLRAFSQFALTLFLCGVAILVVGRYVLVELSEIGSLADRATWIGFWGNILGGAIGLFGGIIAAYAAVKAVQRQISHQDQIREATSQELLEDLANTFVVSAEVVLPVVKEALNALKDDVAILDDDARRFIDLTYYLNIALPLTTKEIRHQPSAHQPSIAFFLNYVRSEKKEAFQLRAATEKFLDKNKDALSVKIVRERIVRDHATVLNRCFLTLANLSLTMSRIDKSRTGKLQFYWGEYRAIASRMDKISKAVLPTLPSIPG